MAEILTLGGILVAVIALGVFLIWRLRRSPARRLRDVLGAISSDTLVDVVIPDGMDGEIQLDHLLLTPAGLLLLELKDVDGTVFAGETLDEWSVLQGMSRTTFTNPIPMLSDRVAALRAIAPGVPVVAYVVFTADVEFPKGHPEMVTTLEQLREAHAQDDLTTPYESRWEEIRAAATLA